MADAQLRLLRARAVAGAEEGRYLPTADVSYAWEQMISIVRAGFLALPTRMAPVLAHEGDRAQVFDLLIKVVEEILTSGPVR